MDHRIFSALAEPNRMRIVELLRAAPRAVGEISMAVGVPQPQVSKHLNTLESVGLVTVHPLGRRRIYSLNREPLRSLRRWLEPFEDEDTSVHALSQYEAAIAAERAGTGPRELSFRREIDATPTAIWRAWTTASVARRWWAPQHFVMAECQIDAKPGGVLRIVLGEGDGTRHVAEGRFEEVDRPHRLSFTLSPIDPGTGGPMFRSLHELHIVGRRGSGSEIEFTINTSADQPGAEEVLAGLNIGWTQTLDQLAAVLTRGR